MDAAIDKPYPIGDLEIALRAAFAESDLKVRSCFSEAKEEKMTVVYNQRSNGWSDLDFQMEILEKRKEFVSGIQKLSRDLGCRVVTADEMFKDDESPYWSVLFDSGVPSLADDLECDSDGDWDHEKLKIVREISNEEFQNRLSKMK
ncbi:hypothetical protein [Pelagicoccus sp. SDUM812003]|uniref:hypothetical protein n=1 Tax=Pelagicoccus sp. SDUM812003 TaxID=3041267 RepID=UPI00280DA84D|nr:hypothetical protein [Pelagicoccus sp. SDUM812003]MDQ8205711.1 hypothetical protein [Pelagicoccus sp. SDUM812003]